MLICRGRCSDGCCSCGELVEPHSVRALLVARGPFRSRSLYREREQPSSLDQPRRCQPAGVWQTRPARSSDSSASPNRGRRGINHIRRKTSDKSFSHFHPRPRLREENCAEGRYSEILSTRFVLSILRCRERGRQVGANCAVIPPSRNLVLNRWSTVGSVHHRRCYFGPTRLARASLSDSHERACQKDRRGYSGLPSGCTRE